VDSRRKYLTGMGQLSLVEHALCPLDPGRSLRPRFVHECEYRYSDRRGRRRSAHVRVTCPVGLSAQDEFYLWGLLALTFAQPAAEIEFHATPHYCLKQLGVIDARSRRGGRQYRQFAGALERLSAVRYQNHAFYDPVRAEHRRVSFGLLSYSLPLSLESSRAWRIVWDPLLFELVSAVGGHLKFDLNVYRELDPASRRLFLVLSKLFRRSARTAVFDLRHLGVQVLGFAPTLAGRDLKGKVARCIARLTDRGIVRQSEPKARFFRKANKAVSVRLERGPYFEQRPRRADVSRSIESPLVGPLRAIGVDERAIGRLLRAYPVRLVQEWVDITLAAQERFGMEFFTRSPAAFFVDNVRNAAAGTRTPPDWWHELRRAERRRPQNRSRPRRGKQSARNTESENKLTPSETLAEAVRVQFEVAGQPSEVARRNAERFTAEWAQGSNAAESDQVQRLLALLA